MPVDILSEVTCVQNIADGTFRLVLDAPEIAEKARPGQFAMVGFGSPFYDPFLRRPLAFAKAEWGRIEFTLRVVGWGTALLADISTGDQMPILGPLGNGFEKPEGRAILVAGGIGLPPLAFAASRWKDVVLLYGEKTASALCHLPHELECEKDIATEDGSDGRKGLVTDNLEEHIKKKPGTVYCCGPVPMLKEAVKICRGLNVRCYVSLEARMACGVGACMGCVIPAINGYKRVCKDGPVFDADEIDWEALGD